MSSVFTLKIYTLSGTTKASISVLGFCLFFFCGLVKEASCENVASVAGVWGIPEVSCYLEACLEAGRVRSGVC